MSDSYVIDVPQPMCVAKHQPAPEHITIRLAPGRWEVTHTSPEEGRDALIFIARRVKETADA